MPATDLQSLDRFLRDEQEKAYCLALRSLGQRDDALDAVQDAMFKLVDRYAHKTASEWAPLFYRILFNRIRDMQRRQQRWGGLLAGWVQTRREDTEDLSPALEELPDTQAQQAPELIQNEQLKSAIDRAVDALPARQREAFVLRSWLEMDVAEAACVMGCSEGSVKTHYSRARQALQQQLAALRKPSEIGDDSTLAETKGANTS